MSRCLLFLLSAVVCFVALRRDCLAQQSAKVAPFAVNAQNYAVVDLSALSTNSHAVTWLALDDSNNAAFGINQGQGPTGQPAELDVYTFTNGGTTPAQPLILTKTDTYAGTQYQNSYTVTSLLASGKVFGYHNYYFKDTSPQNYSGSCYNGFSAVGNTCSDASMPSLFLPYVKKPYTQLKCTATDGSYAGIGIYANTMFDPSYPGDDSGDPAAVDFIVHAGVSDCFAPFAPTSASNASTRIHTEEHFAINAINAKGWALGVGYDKNSDPISYSQYTEPSHSLGNQIWNADQQQFVNLDTPAVAINDDNDVLVSGTQDSTTHRYSGAFLFEKGDTSNKHYFLPNGSGGSDLLPAKSQPHFRNLQPQWMSNRAPAPTDGSVKPVLNILFKAEIERNPNDWEASTFLLHVMNDGTTDVGEVAYPGSVTNVQLKSINNSGVIAALGNPGTGDSHALLLVPVTFSVIDWQPTVTSPTISYQQDSAGNVQSYNIEVPNNGEIMNASTKVRIDFPDIGQNDVIAKQFELVFLQNIVVCNPGSELGYHSPYAPTITNEMPVPGQDSNVTDPNEDMSEEGSLPRIIPFNSNHQLLLSSVEDSPARVGTLSRVNRFSPTKGEVLSDIRNNEFINYLFVQFAHNQTTTSYYKGILSYNPIYLKWFHWTANYDVNFDFSKAPYATKSIWSFSILQQGDGVGPQKPVYPGAHPVK